ncbi:MAG TPA: PEP/pyruvate-binding domain-containing protein, partial [Natronosporangium sp.]
MPQRPHRYVVPLSALGRQDTRVAGGKAANLGELVRAGAPVPAGFVLTTAALTAHLDHNRLTARLPELLDASPDGAAVRQAVRSAPVPPPVADSLRRAYADLVGGRAGGAVAVRSSATTEDLPGASLAGQYRSVLNVVGVPALLDAVRECWASLWSARALAYRRRHGLDEARMAVVVQRLVPAELSGVLFTADPVTGARDRIVVDAAAGLGEAVVAGLVTPDHVVLDKRTGRVRSRRAGRREVAVVPRPGGGTRRVAAPAGPRLRRAQLRRLARLAVAAERRFGRPLDVEWAWYHGRPWLLQARPVTALPPPPPRPPGRYGRMMAPLVAEVLPVRPYPMDTSTWLGGLLRVSTQVVRDLGFAGAPLGRLVFDDDGVVVRLDPPRLRPTWRVLLLPVTLRRLARRGAADRWVRAEPAEEPAGVSHLADLGWAELVDTLRRASVVPRTVIERRLGHLPDAVSLLWLWLTLRLLHRGDLLGDLVSGTDNQTARTARALDALAVRIRRDRSLAHLFATVDAGRLLPVLAERHPDFLAAFRTFLARYGHRETASPLLASQPTWADEPRVVLGLLRARAGTVPPPPADTRPAWQRARDDLLRHPLLRPAPARRAVLRWLAASRRAFQAREDSRFLLTRRLPLVRGCIRELGRRLWTAGVLARPEDVLHLTVDELARVRRWP